MVYGVADRGDSLTRDLCVSLEPALPELGADHGNGRAFGRIFLRKKAAPQHRIDAQNPQESGREAGAFQNLRFCSASKREVFLAGEGSDIGERVRTSPNLLK